MRPKIGVGAAPCHQCRTRILTATAAGECFPSPSVARGKGTSSVPTGPAMRPGIGVGAAPCHQCRTRILTATAAGECFPSPSVARGKGTSSVPTGPAMRPGIGVGAAPCHQCRPRILTAPRPESASPPHRSLGEKARLEHRPRSPRQPAAPPARIRSSYSIPCPHPGWSRNNTTGNIPIVAHDPPLKTHTFFIIFTLGLRVGPQPETRFPLDFVEAVVTPALLVPRFAPWRPIDNDASPLPRDFGVK